MTKSETFKAAHAAARKVVAEQIAIKHPSSHRSYRAIFADCLRGIAILARPAVETRFPNAMHFNCAA